MTCPSCAEAATNPRTPMFNAGCRECESRSLAGGPQFWKARMYAKKNRGGMDPDWRDALVRIFGAGWQEAHKRVRAWYDRIQGAQC